MCKTHSHHQNGNVLFFILIAVALFAALSYQVTQSSRGNSGDISKEQATLDQAKIDSYMAAIQTGQMSLNIIEDCETIDYTPPADWGSEDKDCHMFHPEGAGVIYQDLGLDICIATEESKELNIGEKCGNIIYAGESGGNRIYATVADQTSTTWNNGTTNWVVTGATSTSDGLANTNTLLGLSDTGSPYQAAGTCRALGSDWYLPSQNELDLFVNNKDEGALSGTFDIIGTYYWSSSESSNNLALRQRFNDGIQGASGKVNTSAVRCARRD